MGPRKTRFEKQQEEMEDLIDMSVNTLRKLTNPRKLGNDMVIPPHIIEQAKGIVFLEMRKAGLVVFSTFGGNGIVIKKIEDKSTGEYHWSLPSAVHIGGVGGGLTIGGERINSIVVLNSSRGVKNFEEGRQSTFGGNLSAKSGPHYITEEDRPKEEDEDDDVVASAYTYSISKGAYAGATLDGLWIKNKLETNYSFYGSSDADAKSVLNEDIDIPKNALNYCYRIQNELKKIHNFEEEYEDLKLDELRFEKKSSTKEEGEQLKETPRTELKETPVPIEESRNVVKSTESIDVGKSPSATPIQEKQVKCESCNTNLEESEESKSKRRRQHRTHHEKKGTRRSVIPLL